MIDERASTPAWRDQTALILGGAAGLLSMVLFFVPLSTVLCAALASYVYGGSQSDGAVVGAVAGLVAFANVLFSVALGASVLDPVVPVEPGFGRVAELFAGFGLVYVVGLAVVGGVIGAVLRARADH